MVHQHSSPDICARIARSLATVYLILALSVSFMPAGSVQGEANQTPVVSIGNAVPIDEGNSGDTTVVKFPVTLSAAGSDTVTVHYSTADGTATTGDSDYELVTDGSITFLTTDSLTQDISINVTGDDKFETDKSFSLTLISAEGATLDPLNATGSATINNDDSQPTLSIGDVTHAEGNSGLTPFTLNVSLSNPSYQAISVHYSTSNGTATVADNDYVAVADAVVDFPANSALPQAITVDVNGDTRDEANETFSVTLANPTNATIASGTGIATITNDDSQPTVSFDAASQTVAESAGTVLVTASLSAISGLAVTVPLSFTGTAEQGAGKDYTVNAASITIPAGDSSGSIDCVINDDALAESSETVIVTMGTPTNATAVSPTAHTITITDNDTLPTLSITNTSVTEGNAGTVDATLTVSLSASSGQTVSVQYATADGSATTADGDYQGVPTAQTLTFAPGETSKPITIKVDGDIKYETDETFSVTLASPTNATIASATGTVTITNDDSQPTVTFTSAGQTVAEGAGTATITAQLSNPSYQAVSLPFTLTGTATQGAGADYTATASPLTIAAGGSSANITVTINDDALDEPDETVIVTLDTPTNASLGTPSSHTLTITDNDATPALSIAGSASVAEGNSGTVNATLSVTLSAASGQTVSVQYTTADGTATTADGDYQGVASPQTLTFTPGQTSQSITIPVNGDTKYETNETFTVTLASPTNATITSGAGTGTVTITNDDSQPTVSFTSAGQTVAESAGTATITAQLSNPSYQDVSVPFTTGGTATQGAGNDYTLTASPITIAAGGSSANITVTINDDALDEPDETVIVTLGTPGNASLGTPSSHTLTIADNDAAPALSIAGSVSVAEGNSGTVDATLTVSLSAPSSQAVSVQYTTADGTATTADGDYQGVTSAQTLTFAAGETSHSITIPVNGDTKYETDETFTVTLASPTNATIASATGTVTITNDDSQPTVTFTSASQTVAESAGTATITAQLSNPSYQDVSVPFTTGGTATQDAGNDYTLTAGPVTIAAGGSSANITVTINDDALDEPDETVIVTLDTPTNATLGTPSSHTLTITDNDATPALSIAGSVSVAEGNSGTVNATLSVTLSAASGQTVSVQYTTADGTATTADSDYQGVTTAQTLTFAAGETSHSITIPVNGDAKYETNETFTVTLASPTNATIASATGTVTITNDDSQPTVSFTSASQTVAESVGTVIITAQLSNPSYQAVSLPFTTSGTASKGPSADYTITDTPLTIAAGGSSANITLTINDDALDEPDETVVVSMGDPDNAALGATTTYTLTISDNDATPTLTLDSSVSVAEGNSGTVNATLNVTLSAASGQTVSVQYTTADGTATTADGDYQGVTSAQTLTFAAGETSKPLTIKVNGDTKYEPGESFTVTLSNPSNATLASGKGSGTVTISNDDGQPTIQFNAANFVTAENQASATITVTLSNPTYQTVTANYVTLDNTALAGINYVSTTGTLTFGPGVTSRSFNVQILKDTTNNPDKTVLLKLTNISGTALTGNIDATLTIKEYLTFLYIPVTRKELRPDLIATFKLVPAELKTGQAFQVEVTVTNQGANDAGEFWVDFYIDPVQPPAPPVNQGLAWYKLSAYGAAWYISGLKAGQSITLASPRGSYRDGNTNWPASLGPGAHNLYVYADSWGFSYGAVDEASEDNNRAELHIVVASSR